MVTDVDVGTVDDELLDRFATREVGMLFRRNSARASLDLDGSM